MEAAPSVLYHGLFGLITDYAVGPQIDLDLDTIYDDL